MPGFAVISANKKRWVLLLPAERPVCRLLVLVRWCIIIKENSETDGKQRRTDLDDASVDFGNHRVQFGTC